MSLMVKFRKGKNSRNRNKLRKDLNLPTVKIGDNLFYLQPTNALSENGDASESESDNDAVEAITLDINNSMNIQELLGQVNNRQATTTMDLIGDVEVPEICAFSIFKNCWYENTGCQRLHSMLPYHWQFLERGHWYNFMVSQSKQIEQVYTHPEKTDVVIDCLNINNLSRNARLLHKILGNSYWTVDLEAMTASNGNVAMPIRRVSTRSSAIDNNRHSTVYVWYFEDESGRWIEYGKINSKGMLKHVPSTTSEDIEKIFCTTSKNMNFQSPKFNYLIDFNAMIQRNLTTNTRRRVRRRPQKYGQIHPSGNQRYGQMHPSGTRRYGGMHRSGFQLVKLPRQKR